MAARADDLFGYRGGSAPVERLETVKNEVSQNGLINPINEETKNASVQDWIGGILLVVRLLVYGQAGCRTRINRNSIG